MDQIGQQIADRASDKEGAERVLLNRTAHRPRALADVAARLRIAIQRRGRYAHSARRCPGPARLNLGNVGSGHGQVLLAIDVGSARSCLGAGQRWPTGLSSSARKRASWRSMFPAGLVKLCSAVGGERCLIRHSTTSQL